MHGTDKIIIEHWFDAGAIQLNNFSTLDKLCCKQYGAPSARHIFNL
jgi:hypothetical protein